MLNLWRAAKSYSPNSGAKAHVVAQTNPTPVGALFIQLLNDLFDLDVKRTAALENRIPQTILAHAEATIGLMSCFSFGYASPTRFWLVWLITPLMIAVVMGLIADLDSPRNGFIRTDLRGVERLEQDLRREHPAAGAIQQEKAH